jgi:hypothetical protein
MQRCLGRPPAWGSGGKRIKPIFQDIEVESAHLHGTEILDAVVNRVELKPIVGFPNSGNQFLELMEGPPINFIKFLVRDSIFFRIEVIEVPQKETVSIPDPKVGIRQSFQNLI